jgi:chromosome segregation protein
VHLKTLTLKGFKSFPDRTQLDFGPGVSVVVGPNGSGKSNITDAVLWAMGEQSPLAVRGSSMQDVIFGGARAVQARSAAEVEIVLDNSDGDVDLPLSEISIVRRLERTGEGSYRLNGARCRLSDVIEALSDTGLGKETHSVISQGRVEEIVTSKPRDRRLLIEEAAGLGKHRKRRQRARLKLERTQLNLDRALDVEREARSRLRPLKRQAEAAELHARLERQTLEARHELARDRSATVTVELREAERQVAGARGVRAQVEESLRAVGERRAQAERALAERARRHDELAGRAYAGRSARERLELRREQAEGSAHALRWRMQRSEAALAALAEGDRAGAGIPEPGAGRVAQLEAELEGVRSRAEHELHEELQDLRAQARQGAERVAELEQEVRAAREARTRAEELVAQAREGSVWSATWQQVRQVIADGVARALRAADERSRAQVASEVTDEAERVARGVVEYALKGARAAEETREQAEEHLRDSEQRRAQAEQERGRAQWLIEQREAAAAQGPLAVQRAALEGELQAERRALEGVARERDEREARVRALRERREQDAALLPLSERLARAIQGAHEAASTAIAELEEQLSSDDAAGERMAEELSACAAEEAEIQARLGAASEAVTEVEVAAQRLRDQAAEAALELRGIAKRLGTEPPELDGGKDGERSEERLDEEQIAAITARLERLERRREQLGPVNPLAQEEYAAAVEHVEEMEGRREDLETAMRELKAVIADTDREIQRSFAETFEAAAANFAELAGELFPGGTGRLRLVRDQQAPRAVLGGQQLPGDDDAGAEAASDEEGPDAEASAELSEHAGQSEPELEGVEIEIAPAGKSTKRLSLLSGGEKSMTALAFLFAVFLARPCPFYILDEVEAALDDLNLDRFLALLRRYSSRAQFIVITHQKRTMEAADWLYGVSMGEDGVSKVLSRRLLSEEQGPAEVAEVA